MMRMNATYAAMRGSAGVATVARGTALAIPNHSLHKASGRGRVRLNGHDHYTGPWGSQEAKQRYDQIIAEWLANGRMLAGPKQIITVQFIVDAFNRHAAVYYRRVPGAGRTSEAINCKHAFVPLLDLYSSLPVGAFTVLQLKLVRQRMIDARLCRSTINARIRRIRHLFKWAISEALCPPEVLTGLQTLEGLKHGRSLAVEREPVRPVPEAHIRATTAQLSPTLVDMVELQLLTGMRPGELCGMTGQIDTAGPVWIYRPARHKTAHHGVPREVFLNQAAQAIIEKYIRLDPAARLFMNSEGRPYTAEVYLYAIRRAAIRAGVPPWGPNRLRHNVATELRARFGLEIAAIILGHRKPDTTLIYAEAPRQAAIQAIAQLRAA